MTIVAADEDIRMVQEVLLNDQTMRTITEVRPLTGMLTCSCGARSVLGFKKSNLSNLSFKKAIQTAILGCHNCGQKSYDILIGNNPLSDLAHLAPRYLVSPFKKGIDNFTITGIEKIQYVVNTHPADVHDSHRYRLKIFLKEKPNELAFLVEGMMDANTYTRLKKDFGD